MFTESWSCDHSHAKSLLRFLVPYAVKLVKLPVNDTNTASCQTNTSPTNNKNEIWKAVRLTSCQKPQLQLVSNLFKFVHMCFLLYLLCFTYLFVMFWAVSFLNLIVSLSLMAVPTVRNFVNGFMTQRRSQLKPTTMKHQTVKLFDLLNMLSGKMQKQKSILPFHSLQFFSDCSKYLLTFLRMIILLYVNAVKRCFQCLRELLQELRLW